MTAFTYSLIYGSSSIQRSDGACIPPDQANTDYVAYLAWVSAGNTATAAVAPVVVPQCQLWQLQAVLTSTQWSAVQAAVTALNNPAVTAFASHGDNLVPANSTTLISLGAAIGLSPAQVTALVTQAAAISIP